MAVYLNTPRLLDPQPPPQQLLCHFLMSERLEPRRKEVLLTTFVVAVACCTVQELPRTTYSFCLNYQVFDGARERDANVDQARERVVIVRRVDFEEGSFF